MYQINRKNTAPRFEEVKTIPQTPLLISLKPNRKFENILASKRMNKENLRGEIASEGRKLLSKIRIFYKIFQNLSPFF